MKQVFSAPSNIPDLPGVYFFKNSENVIIYIGKAKSLKKRIATYFHKQVNDWKINSLLEEHATLDWVLTKNELEALLLEAQLIQEHKPKYNVLLTSGNPFVYILFSQGELPTLKLVRQKKERGTYFGPFLHKSAARSGFEYIMRTFKLRLCNKKINTGCLDYHLDNCAGTCLSTFNKEDYLFRFTLAQKALEGNFDTSKQLLEEKLTQALKERAFEHAKHLHNYLINLTIIFDTIATKFNEKKYDTELFAITTPLAIQETVITQGLVELKQLLKLPIIPQSIDCFDISHFQSSYIVGSCIRFTEGKPDPQFFRRFRIKTITTQDDYAALKEIVHRRYDPARAHSATLPDIVLIDGGKGQRAAAQAILPEHLVISLAKREERLFTPLHPEGVILNVAMPLGKLLIALRDYAHHFAVSYHKLLRNKGLRASQGTDT